jgi:hypothetical protein
LTIAGYLARLGVSDGYDCIIACLQSPDPELRRMALVNWDIDAAPPRNRAERDLLYSLLNDENIQVQSLVIDACCYLNTQETISVFKKLLETEECPNRDRIASWLLSHECSEEHVGMVERFLRHSRSIHDIRRSLFALQAATQYPAFADKALTAIEDFFLNSENEFRCHPDIVEPLCKIGRERALPAFRFILEHANASGSQYYALGAIARLNPRLSLELLAPRLDNYLSSSVFQAFQISACARDWKDLVHLVRDALLAKKREFPITREVVDLFLDHGGEPGRSIIVENLPQLWPPVRMHASWKLNGWTAQKALQELKDRGVIEELPDASLIEKKRNNPIMPVADETELLPMVLESMKIMRVFSYKSREDLADYCELLAEFSKVTGGAFAPKYCQQRWKRELKEDYDYAAFVEDNRQLVAESREPLPLEYLEEDINHISFVQGNKLFEFETYASDNIYIWTAVAAVNAALEHTDELKRVLQWPTQDGLYHCLFAEPEKVRQFFTSYSIPTP